MALWFVKHLWVVLEGTLGPGGGPSFVRLQEAGSLRQELAVAVATAMAAKVRKLESSPHHWSPQKVKCVYDVYAFKSSFWKNFVKRLHISCVKT